MSLFSGCPDLSWPHESTNDARIMLLKAHETASAFLQAYKDSRKGKTGASTDAEQDLLRAMTRQVPSRTSLTGARSQGQGCEIPQGGPLPGYNALEGARRKRC